MTTRVPVVLTATAATVVASLAFWLSFSALTDLAALNGVPAGQAWAVPLVVDGLAVVATVAVAVSVRHRWYPWLLLIAATVLSVVGNAVHAADAGTVAVGIAVTPPVAMLAAVHLTVALARQRRTEVPQPQEVPRPDEATAAPVRQPQVNPGAAPASHPAAAQVVDLAAHRGTTTRTARPTAPDAAVDVGDAAALFDLPRPDTDAPVPHPPHTADRAAPAAAPDSSTAAAHRAAAALHAAGHSCRGIAAELGISDRTVRRWRDDGLLTA